MEWISVKDRLPGAEGTYIVCTKNNAVTITHFYEKHKIWGGKSLNRLIDYWMPLPEPPKDEEEELKAEKIMIKIGKIEVAMHFLESIINDADFTLTENEKAQLNTAYFILEKLNKE